LPILLKGITQEEESSLNNIPGISLLTILPVDTSLKEADIGE
jgi:hypothetical protein